MVRKRLEKILDNMNKKSSKSLSLLLILSILGTSLLIGCGTKQDNVDLEPTKYKTINDLEGVTMFSKEGTADRKGLTLIFGNKIQPEVIYGDDFVLEKKIEGIWYELPVTIDGEYGFNDIAYTIPFDGAQQKVEWGWLYGELKPGEYRIIKEILNSRSAGDFDTHFLAAEFQVY